MTKIQFYRMQTNMLTYKHKIRALLYHVAPVDGTTYSNLDGTC